MPARLLPALSLLLFACGGDADPTETGGATAPAPEPVAFANGTSPGQGCDGVEGLLYPYVAELGEWAAVAVKVREDATIDTVRYDLYDGPGPSQGDCTAGPAHQVRVWVGDDATPPSAPPADSQLVDAPAGDGSRTVELILDSPLTVADGQFVFVAVEMLGEGSRPMCLVWCDTDYHADRNWWSYATAEPFSWGEAPCGGDLEVEVAGSSTP